MANKVQVINLTKLTQHVGVLHANGDPDAVQVVAKQKVFLRDGMIVNPRWLGLNPNVIQVVMPDIPLKASVVTKGGK